MSCELEVVKDAHNGVRCYHFSFHIPRELQIRRLSDVWTMKHLFLGRWSLHDFKNTVWVRAWRRPTFECAINFSTRFFMRNLSRFCVGGFLTASQHKHKDCCYRDTAGLWLSHKKLLFAPITLWTNVLGIDFHTSCNLLLGKLCVSRSQSLLDNWGSLCAAENQIIRGCKLVQANWKARFGLGVYED